MANKNFQQAPKKPSNPTPEQIDAFVNGDRAGQSAPQTHKTSNVGKADTSAGPLKRLSVDLPEKTHQRFKTVCSASGKKMTREIEAFINRRIAELEKETGIRS